MIDTPERKYNLHEPEGSLESITHDLLERKKDSRVLILPFGAQLFILRNSQPLEKRPAVAADVEEAVEHTHVQGLAEAAGAGEQSYLILLVADYRRNKPRLVDVVELLLAYL